MTVYLCEPHFESMLCAIYDAWDSGKGHENVRIELEGAYRDLELFTQYVQVPFSEDKARKVIRSISQKISAQAYEKVYVSSLSQEDERADRIYRFLIQGFVHGAKVLDMIQLPEVYEIFQMCRNVYNENHQLTQFVRFSQTGQGVLISRIGPKNDVLPLLAPFFADRLPMENWMIYDETRRKAAVHPAGEAWMFLYGDSQPEACFKGQLDQATDQAEYESLWKAFHETVAIEARKNPTCQRNHLPLRFRPYMTEFQK